MAAIALWQRAGLSRELERGLQPKQVRLRPELPVNAQLALCIRWVGEELRENKFTSPGHSFSV